MRRRSGTAAGTNNALHEESSRNPNSQNPAKKIFRRPRAGRACGTCHSRRVRCDAGSHGLPCTNCVAFELECSIPPKGKKKRYGDTAGSLTRYRKGGMARPHLDERNPSSAFDPSGNFMLQLDGTNIYAELIQPNAKSEIDDPGRVAYLEEFSNMSLIIQAYQGPIGVHYPLPKTANGPAKLTSIGQAELEILEKRGALSLPPKQLCDELVDAYFTWVAPIVPIINRTIFLQRYRDSNNPPPILIMQAVLLAGSRVCNTPLLLDSNGSPISAATLLYQRVKALYDSNYEEDRVTTIQALILMGWFWEDSGRVPKNVFYWNGLAIAVAQGCGMHRSTKGSRLSPADQRLWTRIWWTLYTRDRSVAVALGRPAQISLIGSDIEMACEDDFIEGPNEHPDTLHVQFFLQYVKLCEVMDLILHENYSISSKSQNRPGALTQCDRALAGWLQRCPTELKWHQSQYSFWPAYLYCMYNTARCLLHRAHLPPAIPLSFTPGPALESANAITSIVKIFVDQDHLRRAPPFIIYSLLSALIVHIYYLHNAIPGHVMARRESIRTCIVALENVSEIWLVAKMVHDLFVILSFDGFDTPLNTKSSHDETNLSPIGVGSTTLESPSGGHSSIGLLGAYKNCPNTLGLTPSLIAHMGAALESATAPKF